MEKTETKKSLWLDRSLLQGPYLALVLNQQDFDAEISKIGSEYRGTYIDPGASAMLTTLHNDSGQLVCIVGMDLDLAAKHGSVEVAALLVHEAVHVWQAVRRTIVRTIDTWAHDTMGSEMEAYAIQNIAQELMNSYASQVYGVEV